MKGGKSRRFWRKTCLLKQITFQKIRKYNKKQKIKNIFQEFNGINVEVPVRDGVLYKISKKDDKKRK